MKRLINILIISQAFCVLASSSLAASLTVNGLADIYGAGHATAPDGQLPPSVSFPTGSTLLTFSGVTGTVSLNGGGNFNDPDGVGAAVSSSSTSSLNGISGITSPNAGELVGVFENGTEPTNSAPASLNFATSGTNFTTLSPLLNQTFFIGDGLTGDKTGSIQLFNVPAGATMLYLGIADAGGYNGSPGSYGDNSGSFIAIFNVVPEPGTYAVMLVGAAMLLAARKLGRRIVEPIR